MTRAVVLRAVALASISASSVVLCSIRPGLAADLSAAIRPQTVQAQPSVALLPSWAGPYLGLQAGYLAGGGLTTFAGSEEFHFVDPKGFAGGVFAGYGRQWGRVVGGLEGDLSFASAGQMIDTGLAPDTTVTQLQTRINWNSHLRGRVGYAFNSVMLFAAGGLALAGVENKAVDNVADVTATWKDTRAGWTLGGGAEYRITSAATARLEYLYDNYGTNTLAAQTVGAVSFAARDHKLDSHTLRAGVSWRF